MPIDLPPVTRALLIANLAIFGLQQLIPDPMIIHFALWPLGTDFAGPDGTRVAFGIWQLVSYGFLHGGFTHLFFNMFALWRDKRFAHRRKTAACPAAGTFAPHAAAIVLLGGAGIKGAVPLPHVGSGAAHVRYGHRPLAPCNILLPKLAGLRENGLLGARADTSALM